MIIRYEPGLNGTAFMGMLICDQGRYILFTDHETALKAEILAVTRRCDEAFKEQYRMIGKLEAERDRLKAALNEIASWVEGDVVTSLFDEPESAKIALEELKAALDKSYPSSSAKEKQARINVMEKVFGTASSTKIEGFSINILETGLSRVKDLLNVPENTIDNVSSGIIVEPPWKDDVPENIGEEKAA